VIDAGMLAHMVAVEPVAIIIMMYLGTNAATPPISYIFFVRNPGPIRNRAACTGAHNTCLSVYANQRIPAAPMTSNRALPWLPKKSSNPLDEAQKPYYCGNSNHHQRRLAWVLPGFAPAYSARASAANHRESISPAGMMTWV
jgi:hypothetical protein